MVPVGHLHVYDVGVSSHNAIESHSFSEASRHSFSTAKILSTQITFQIILTRPTDASRSVAIGRLIAVSIATSARELALIVGRLTNGELVTVVLTAVQAHGRYCTKCVNTRALQFNRRTLNAGTSWSIDRIR